MEYLAKRWAHQIKAEDKAFFQYLGSGGQDGNFGYALLMEMGTGKTLTMINILRRIVNHEKRMLRVLIFAPPIVCSNWKDEFKKFSKIDSKGITVLLQSGKKRLKIFNDRAFDAADKSKRPHIFITSYESLTGKVGSDMKELFHNFLSWEPEILVLDESHKIKDGTTKRAKAIDRLANPRDPRLKKQPIRPSVFLLTGTPVLNSPMDLFSQWKALDGGQTFGANFFVFRAKYFEDRNANMPKHNHFPDWRIKKGAVEEINRLIGSKSITAFKKDCLDLPPLLNQTILLDMTDEQKYHYEAMREDLITFMNKEACIAELALTKALRLLQISSGYLKLADGTEPSFKEIPKQKALIDLLEDIAPHHKVIVWAVFKHDYRIIKDICLKLKLSMVALHGGMPNETRRANIVTFNTDHKCRVLVGHPRSGGIGINLTASNYSIYYSRNFSLEDRLQSEARNYRGGSEIHEKITHIDLVMRGTIEEKVTKVLHQKQQMGISLLKEII